MAGPDYIVDIDGLKQRDGSPAPDEPVRSRGRPWLAVLWRCCSTYSRVYRNAEGTAYEGRCPKCLRPVRIRIGPSGTHTRFFEAS